MDRLDYLMRLYEVTKGMSSVVITYGNEEYQIPNIVRGSVKLYKDFLKNGAQNIVFVFPERRISSTLFLISAIIDYVIEVKKGQLYDPTQFVKGQRLVCDKCIVEFDHIGPDDQGKIRFYVNDAAGCLTGIAFHHAPIFQKTKISRRLTSDSKFCEYLRSLQNHRKVLTDTELLIERLTDLQTHLDKTFVYVSSVGRCKELLSTMNMGGKPITDILLVGQIVNGKVENVSHGQLEGCPSLLIAPDLYVVLQAISNKVPIDGVFIDLSGPNIITNQLDALDDLMIQKCPIVWLSDTVNSFALKDLIEREFIIWRWDAENIAKPILGGKFNRIDAVSRNCLSRKVDYIECVSGPINDTIRMLHKHKDKLVDPEPLLEDVIYHLFSISFIALRSLIETSSDRADELTEGLMKCVEKLESIRHYLPDKVLFDMRCIIDKFSGIFVTTFKFPKINQLERMLKDGGYPRVCIVIPDSMDQEEYEKHWSFKMRFTSTRTNVLCLTVSDYIANETIFTDLTVVCGWLNSARMRQILYSYKSPIVWVMLYEQERSWSVYSTKSWAATLHDSSSRRAISEILHVDFIGHRNESENSIDKGIHMTDKQPQEADSGIDEIEDWLQLNKYRKYAQNIRNNPSEEQVEVIPIRFVGGFLVFFKPVHKVVSVTRILLSTKNNIDQIPAKELKRGDFVVLRGSQKDLVREVADIILGNSGMSGLRDIAQKWRDPLKREYEKSDSLEELVRKLRSSGCIKAEMTIRQWIYNDDIIAPQELSDIKCIAIATKDKVLTERLDEIFEAGLDVKRAHLMAGKWLSQLLRKHIAEEIGKLGEIDPTAVTLPIIFNMEDIGKVQILKVIDIGEMIMVGVSNTNSLIREG